MDVEPVNVYAFTMHSAASNVKALREWRVENGKSCTGSLLTNSMCSVPCLSHMLQNSIADAFKQAPHAENLKNEVNKLMKILKNRLAIRHMLRDNQRKSSVSRQALEPVTFNSTRWHRAEQIAWVGSSPPRTLQRLHSCEDPP